MRHILITLPLVVSLLSGIVTPVRAADRDHDGLRDDFEARYGVTSPDLADSDGDGVIDAAEDGDGDSLSNLGEQRFGTDPGKTDSDGDGAPDGAEDADGDGRTNATEQDQRPLPRSLRPALARAADDVQPRRKACQTPHGRSGITSCTFGDSHGETRIVLAGDSHAMMYLTPLIHIARAHGWQLTTMTKSACPALLGLVGNNQWQIDRGRSCRRWQGRTVTRLSRSPVDLVVYAHTSGYKLRKRDGAAVKAWKRAGQWRVALRDTVTALPPETAVLVLGGTPRNFGQNPVNCLRDHRADISACSTRRQPEEMRSMDKGLRQTAAVTRAVFDSLYDQVCAYDPCPLVQGDILMWRDGSHLSETFARQLQPSLERILLEALAARPTLQDFTDRP